MQHNQNLTRVSSTKGQLKLKGQTQQQAVPVPVLSSIGIFRIGMGIDKRRYKMRLVCIIAMIGCLFCIGFCINVEFETKINKKFLAAC